ncbi:DUF4062 domain-containing protein [Desulfocastanea catecholica]
MDKRYQVFVSSTYIDLKTERQQVIQALMEMDCIPAGMELFPAADEEQWEFIKRVIDDCDYYLLIIGGRYGSISPDGISYTEMEYDYAVENGLKVIALIHEEPESLPAKNVELEAEAQKRLSSFRGKVSKGRLVKYWSSTDQLAGLVALSLSKTIKMYPAVGWVRADQGNSTELLHQLNQLRNREEELQKELKKFQALASNTNDSNYSSGDEEFEVYGKCQIEYRDSRRKWARKSNWNEIISVIGPHLFQYQNENFVSTKLATELLKLNNNDADEYYSNEVDDGILQTIKIQLMALGIIQIEPLQTKGGDMALFWQITEKGKKAVVEIRSIKK